MNWEAIMSGLWTFANSPLGVALAVGIIGWLVSKLWTAKPAWQKWEGTIIAAVKAAEKAISDDSPNTSLARLNSALQYVIMAYEKANAGKAPPAALVASVTQGIQIVHANLEAVGNLDGKAKPPAADDVTGGTSVATLLLCVGLAGLLLTSIAGCWNPSDAVKGAPFEVSIIDPNSHKALKYSSQGKSENLSKFRMSSAKTGQSIAIGAMASEDVVADNQAAYGINQNQVVGQVANVFGNVILGILNKQQMELQQPIQTQPLTQHSGVPALPVAQGGQVNTPVSSMAAMLLSESLDEDDAIALLRLVKKAQGKAKAEPVMPKKKAPPATQPSAKLEPTTRPIPLESLLAPSGS